jgi:hypothetical protein
MRQQSHLTGAGKATNRPSYSVGVSGLHLSKDGMAAIVYSIWRQAVTVWRWAQRVVLRERGRSSHKSSTGRTRSLYARHRITRIAHIKRGQT